ncbi:MAG: hypothetical protein KTR21_00200 [Rhodobacteraceae bacterium]|nr:hypothetical protein [Paracoccaceae bacterium]
MLKSVIEYIRSEDGAVTVDWVALTGAIAVAGMAVAAFIYTEGINPLAANLAENIGTATAPVIPAPVAN